MKIYSKILSLAAAAALVFSCQKDGPQERDGSPIVPEGEVVTVEFSLEMNPLSKAVQSPGPVGYANRSHSGGLDVTYDDSYDWGTRGSESAMSDDAERLITDLWLFQFNGTGDALQLPPTYISSDENLVRDQYNNSKYTIKASLVASTETCVFFIANIGDSPAVRSAMDNANTLAEFKELCVSYTSESDVTQTGTKIAMCGRYKGALPATSKPCVWVDRMAARLQLNVITTANFDADSPWMAAIHSAPNRTYMYEPARWDSEPAEGWLYPELITENYFDYELAELNFIPQDNGAQATIYWYVPENRRGTNSNLLIDMQKQKWTETDPSFTSPEKKSYATRMVLEGACTDKNKKDIYGSYITRYVTITLYPGENNHDDFNVIRNHSYNMTAKIANLDDDDKRVVAPYITYNYFYGDPSNAGPYTPINEAKVYSGEIRVGEPIDEPDTEHLQYGYRFIPDEPEAFGMGRTKSGEMPMTVNADNLKNVINIYYDLQTGGGSTFIVRYVEQEFFYNTSVDFDDPNLTLIEEAFKETRLDELVIVPMPEELIGKTRDKLLPPNDTDDPEYEEKLDEWFELHDYLLEEFCVTPFGNNMYPSNTMEFVVTQDTTYMYVGYEPYM